MSTIFRKLKHIGLSVLVVTSLSTTISSTAQAGVYKTINGVSCNETNSDVAATTDRSTTKGIYATGVTGGNGGNGAVYCGLEIDSPTAGLPVQIYLYYTKTAGSSMDCFTRSVPWDLSSSTATPITLVEGVQNNVFLTVDTAAYGSISVYCRLRQADDGIQSINYKLN